MKLIHRIGYYLGGFSIGLILLAFFLSGKRTSCDYGPDARVLKNISLKQHQYSEDALKSISNNGIDSLSLAKILRFGDVNFSKSNTDLDSCKIYVVEGDYNDREVSLTIENCDSIAKINKVEVN